MALLLMKVFHGRTRYSSGGSLIEQDVFVFMYVLLGCHDMIILLFY